MGYSITHRQAIVQRATYAPSPTHSVRHGMGWRLGRQAERDAMRCSGPGQRGGRDGQRDSQARRADSAKIGGRDACTPPHPWQGEGDLAARRWDKKRPRGKSKFKFWNENQKLNSEIKNKKCPLCTEIAFIQFSLRNLSFSISSACRSA